MALGNTMHVCGLQVIFLELYEHYAQCTQYELY